MVASSAGVALAQEATTTEERQLTLPGGKVFLDAFVEVNLSKDLAFKPVSVAPDLWYGVSDGGLCAMSFDPFTLSFKLGAIARLQSGAFSFELGPNLFIGLTERSAGNKEVLTVPATFRYAVMPTLGIAAQLGLLVRFADTSLTMLAIPARPPTAAAPKPAPPL